MDESFEKRFAQVIHDWAEENLGGCPDLRGATSMCTELSRLLEQVLDDRHVDAP